MDFPIPEPQVRGHGRITDRRTGQVTHFWIGAPQAPKNEEPSAKPEGEGHADPV